MSRHRHSISHIAAAIRAIREEESEPPQWIVRVVSAASFRECLSRAYTMGAAVDAVLEDSEEEVESVTVVTNPMWTRWKETQR